MLRLFCNIDRITVLACKCRMYTEELNFSMRKNLSSWRKLRAAKSELTKAESSFRQSEQEYLDFLHKGTDK